MAWPSHGGLLAQLYAQALTWLREGGDRSTARRVAGAAFVIRASSAALIYLSQIFLARWIGSFEFGIYVYVWTIVALVGDLTDLGFATAAQRFVPEYTSRGSFELLRGFLSRSRWVAVCSATALAGAGLLLTHALNRYVDHYILLPLSIACATLPFYALMQMQDGIARSYNWIHMALLPPYIVRHLVMLTLVILAYLLDLPTTAETAVMAVAVSLVLTVTGQTLILNRKLRQTITPGPKAYETKTWLATSLPIFMVEGFYLLLTNTDIMMLKQFCPPDQVAVYYAAAKTLALIAFVHFAVGAAVGHRFSAYYVAGDRQKLNAIVADSVRWTFWASLAATGMILVIGMPVLALFGNGFTGGYHLMAILAVGMMARAACGPVERLLNMVGRQNYCAVAYATALVLNVTLGLILIPRIGLDGAALATATALVVESILLFLITRSTLGLHVFIWGRR